MRRFDSGCGIDCRLGWDWRCATYAACDADDSIGYCGLLPGVIDGVCARIGCTLPVPGIVVAKPGTCALALFMFGICCCGTPPCCGTPGIGVTLGRARVFCRSAGNCCTVIARSGWACTRSGTVGIGFGVWAPDICAESCADIRTDSCGTADSLRSKSSAGDTASSPGIGSLVTVNVSGCWSLLCSSIRGSGR